MMDKREQQQNRHKAQLRELEADIENLKALARKTRADAKAGYREQISRLEQKLDAARQKAGGLRDSSGDAWDELRSGVEHAMIDLKSGITAARKTVSPN
jgi:predicted  nucleic acid-binding Zn-ribbon protein